MSTLNKHTLAELNYKAIVAVSVVAYILGGLWYSPALFESAWMSAHGYDRDQVDAILDALVPFGFISSFLAYVVTGIVIALFCRALRVDNAVDGAIAGFTLWLGFAASLGLMVNLFSTNSMNVWVIDSTFQLVFLVAAGAIFATWRKKST